MGIFTQWSASRRSKLGAVLVAIIVVVPLTLAVLHPGFPTSDVELTSRDVWVTNGEQLLGGRLNRQIDELNGSVVAGSPKFDVLQDGDVLFMYNPDAGRVESVSPASTKVTSAIDVPKHAELSYGNDTLAIVSPAGELWIVPTAGDLQFNYTSTKPLLKLGKGGHAVVTQAGAVVAVSRTTKSLYRIDPGSAPARHGIPALGAFQLSAVGDQAVIFDQSTNVLVKEDGTQFALGTDKALQLQQVGADAPFAVLAAGDGVLKVNLGSGAVDAVSAGIKPAVKSAKGASHPVFLDGCIHGAWAGAQRYLMSCEGKASVTRDIPSPTSGDTLEFRVNKSVIALNDLDNGNAWIPSKNLRLVDNWDDVTPPVQKDGPQGTEKSATESFEDTLAERTPQNRPPTAVDDVFGVRPDKTTILPLLDNDTDPDGDVLVISAHGEVSADSGVLDLIDGGRALQYTPAKDYAGGVFFNYTVDDGRGGKAQAQVTVNVRADAVNAVPTQLRKGTVTVEANQTVDYDVLADWRDPDGDDLYLVAASPKSGDLVRFTPDGYITFTHQTSEIGKKEVAYQVSDGRGELQSGILEIDVEAAGSLNPVGTPDFATTFVNQTVMVEPLANDRSPSGEQLGLLAVDDPGGAATASLNADQGTVAVSATAPGIFYLKYTLSAGAKTSVGLIRVDVRANPAAPKLPIAVPDVAYLRGDSPTTVSVLANDVSPSGGVLAVQSVTVAPELLAKGLVVEALESTLVRVTSPAALTTPVQFSYTISDGTSASSATVSVVPVAPLTTHQPPVALSDNVRVRAGDVVTVDVLKNDFHPDDVPMTVDSKLIVAPSAGIAFVNENTVRFQAPTTAGEYHADYRVKDQFGESATATVTFTVTPIDAKHNQDPQPVPLVARVLAGGKIHVDIPLDGVDPDGDAVELLKFPRQAALGVITDHGPTSFDYVASKLSAGTDTFSYQVVDAFGATGVGEVKIAVIPEPKTNLPPNAAPDSIQVRPGRIAQADLTANDSDPQSAPIKVSKKLIDVPKGIKAQVVDGHNLVLTAPDESMAFSLRYALTNDRGGRTVSYVQVQVTPDAPLLPPTASDYAIKTETIAGKNSTDISLFPKYAFNPAGRTEDLVVSFEGPNAGSAEKLESPGRIRVTPGKTRQAIAYRVTNVRDKLSAMAFIIVPAAVSDTFDDPPEIDPTLPTQYVGMNETKTWDLKDILKVPSGRDAMLTDPAAITAIQANGDKLYVDNDTLQFTPKKDYRGPAAILFTVTDGASKDDPKGNRASLRLNIVVGDPSYKDTPPEFTPPNVSIEPGEPTTIDLRSSTQHPNPQILQEVTYSNLTGARAGMIPGLSGSKLTLTAARATRKGANYTLQVTLRSGKFTVPGTIHVTVVKSSKPPAVANPDAIEGKRNGPAVTLNPLANDSNPFRSSGEPLTITNAVVQNTTSGATVSHTASHVTIKPGSAIKSGVVTVVYTIQDATQDPDRNTQGFITFTISDVPAQIAAPARVPNQNNGGDRTATFKFAAPATNGKPITSYQIRTTPALGSYPTCTAGVNCTLTGLANGTAYKLSAIAYNVNGHSEEWSPWSAAITPYGTPAQVKNVRVTSASNDSHANSTVTWKWNAVADTGGTTTYYWSVSGGKSGHTTSTSDSVSLGAGDYTMKVYAQNAGGLKGAVSAASPSKTIDDAAPEATLSRGSKAPGSGYYFHLKLTNYGSGGSVAVICYNRSGSAVTGTTYNLPRDFSGDLNCYSGFPSYWVTVNGKKSNTVDGW